MGLVPFPRGLARAAAMVLALLVAPGSAAADLTVGAASSLTEAFEAIGAAFRQRHPGVDLRFSFAASGTLLAQLEAGAPIDVWASADAATMEAAVQAGVVAPDAPRDFARNALVVVVRTDAEAPPAALADLRDPRWARLAIGQPESVPAGRYARDALVAAGLWSTLEPRLIGAQNVRQALGWAVQGEVDAAFVYASDARVAANALRVAFTVATPGPVRYPVAVTRNAAGAATARAFVDFLLGPEAQALLRRHGFLAP